MPSGLRCLRGIQELLCFAKARNQQNRALLSELTNRPPRIQARSPAKFNLRRQFARAAGGQVSKTLSKRG